MRRAVLAGLLALAVLSPTASVAADPNGGTGRGPADVLEDATRRIMSVLEMVMRSIPQYEMPEILDNGDIIIRRKHPKPPPKEAPKEAPKRHESKPVPPAKGI